MKKIFLSLTLLLAMTSIHLMAQHEASTNTKVGIGTAFPAVDLLGLDGKRVTQADLKANQPIVVFYFDPFCDHCQKEAGWINENPGLWKGITLLWVSWGEMEDIKEFRSKYLPDGPKEMIFTKDDKFEFDNYFGYSNIPTVYVYNSKWLRTASFDKETKPEILVKFARQ